MRNKRLKFKGLRAAVAIALVMTFAPLPAAPVILEKLVIPAPVVEKGYFSFYVQHLFLYY